MKVPDVDTLCQVFLSYPVGKFLPIFCNYLISPKTFSSIQKNSRITKVQLLQYIPAHSRKPCNKYYYQIVYNLFDWLGFKSEERNICPELHFSRLLAFHTNTISYLVEAMATGEENEDGKTKTRLWRLWSPSLVMLSRWHIVEITGSRRKANLVQQRIQYLLMHWILFFPNDKWYF